MSGTYIFGMGHVWVGRSRMVGAVRELGNPHLTKHNAFALHRFPAVGYARIVEEDGFVAMLCPHAHKVGFEVPYVELEIPTLPER